MKAHQIAALIGSVGLSGMALTDAFGQATTGPDSRVADDAGPVGAVLAGAVWLTYAALTWVLIAEAARFVAANRAARIGRWVLVVGLAASVVSSVVIVPALLLTESADMAFAAVFGAVRTPILVSTILGDRARAGDPCPPRGDRRTGVAWILPVSHSGGGAGVPRPAPLPVPDGSGPWSPSGSR